MEKPQDTGKGKGRQTKERTVTIRMYVYGKHTDICKGYCESESRLVVSDSATPWTVACQASLSMEFSRQNYWSG